MDRTELPWVVLFVVLAGGCSSRVAAVPDVPSPDARRPDTGCELHLGEPLTTAPDDIDFELPMPGDQRGERWEGTRLVDGAPAVLQLDSAPDGGAPTTGTLLVGAARDWGLPTSPDEPWPPEGDAYAFNGAWHWDGYTYVVQIDQWDGLVGRLYYDRNDPYRRWCDLQPVRRGVGDVPTPTRRDAYADFGNIPFPNRCFWADDDRCTWHEAPCMTVVALARETPVCDCDREGCFASGGGAWVDLAFTGDVATGDEYVLRRVP